LWAHFVLHEPSPVHISAQTYVTNPAAHTCGTKT
jgi:hypothetical protein